MSIVNLDTYRAQRQEWLREQQRGGWAISVPWAFIIAATAAWLYYGLPWLVSAAVAWWAV